MGACWDGVGEARAGGRSPPANGGPTYWRLEGISVGGVGRGAEDVGGPRGTARPLPPCPGRSRQGPASSGRGGTGSFGARSRAPSGPAPRRRPPRNCPASQTTAKFPRAGLRLDRRASKILGSAPRLSETWLDWGEEHWARRTRSSRLSFARVGGGTGRCVCHCGELEVSWLPYISPFGFTFP